MNQLFLNEQPTELFFKFNITANDLKQWLENQESSFVKNVFEVKELHSCHYTVLDDNTLVIKGDEDYQTLTLEHVWCYTKMTVNGENDLIRQPSN